MFPPSSKKLVRIGI